MGNYGEKKGKMWYAWDGNDRDFFGVSSIDNSKLSIG